MSRFECPECDERLTAEERAQGRCPICGTKLSSVARRSSERGDEEDEDHFVTAKPARRPRADRRDDEEEFDEDEVGSAPEGTTTITLYGRAGYAERPRRRLCMCCGARASSVKEVKFSWRPSWVGFLIVFGLLPYLIMSLIMQKTMRVDVPRCERHRHPWLSSQLLLGLCVVYLLGGGFVCIFVAGLLERAGPAGGSLVAGLFIGWLVGFVILLIVTIVVTRRTIRPLEITEDSITLANVSETFADHAF